MTAMLENRASPLYNRVRHRIELKHWDFATLFETFGVHGTRKPLHRPFRWSLFEGVPKFCRDCFEAGVLEPRDDDRTETLRLSFFEGTSRLRDQAVNWFLRELRGRYDAVLKLLASKGPCSYREFVDAGYTCVDLNDFADVLAPAPLPVFDAESAGQS